MLRYLWRTIFASPQANPDSNVMPGMEDLQNCRVCVNMDDWRAKTKQLLNHEQKMNSNTITRPHNANQSVSTEDCPPDGAELGRATWTFLHTLSTYYPDKPSLRQQREMTQFLQILGNIYPCPHCAQHYREGMAADPASVESRLGLQRWLCRRHNDVNRLQGKPEFDCDRVWERWNTSSNPDCQ